MEKYWKTMIELERSKRDGLNPERGARTKITGPRDLGTVRDNARRGPCSNWNMLLLHPPFLLLIFRQLASRLPYVTDKQILEDEVIVEARLTVRTPGGQTIVKTQFGGADIKRHSSGAKSGRPLSIADDYKAAASDALKKCASLLGIGLDLYGRDRPYDQEEPQSQQAGQPGQAVRQASKDPAQIIDVGIEIGKIAGGNNGLCTPAQWREIGKLAGQAGMDVAELCASLAVGTLSQLTEARAQRVINRLRELAGESSFQAS